ncbi:MAG: YdcF family protein [Actinomycetota bacterium]|nr:YdcF family protein [Actinomycetota bacterium]
MFTVIRRALVALVLVTMLVVGGTAASIWYVARGDARPVSDVILVLGAAQYSGKPSSVLEARLEQAKKLFDQGVAPRVVTVGGSQAGDRTTEAEAGADYLRDRGVDEVVAVEEGIDTLTSLQAVAVLLDERGWDTVVLVTDPWHSLRSRTMAGDVGIDAVTSPTRAGPSVRTRGTQARYVARETAAILYYKVFGRSSDAGPQAV